MLYLLGPRAGPEASARAGVADSTRTPHNSRMLVDAIIQGEVSFPSRLAHVVEREYGLIYHASDNVDYYDGNHAWILKQYPLERAVADILSFYRSRAIKPRVYHPSRQGDGEGLRRLLRDRGWQFSRDPNVFYVQADRSRIVRKQSVSIRRVTSASPALIDTICQCDSMHAAKAIRSSLKCPDYHLLVAFFNEEPVSMASVQRARVACRIDDVRTHPAYRGRGFIREVIDELVSYHARTLGGTLYLYSDNPRAMRVYEAAGFSRLEPPLEYWSAWQE